MELIEASITAGVRPTTMILGSDNRKKWSDMDVLIMRAYQRYKSEMCPEHGGPLWLCRNGDLRLNVRLKRRPACAAASAINDDLKKRADKGESTDESTQAEFFMRNDDDFDLLKLRRAYFEDLAKGDDDDEEEPEEGTD